MRCQHFWNPKAPRLLGRCGWNLARVFYGSADNFWEAEFWIVVPVLHGANTNLAHSFQQVKSHKYVNKQWIFTQTKDIVKCRFRCKLLGSGILNSSPYVVQGHPELTPVGRNDQPRPGYFYYKYAVIHYKCGDVFLTITLLHPKWFE